MSEITALKYEACASIWLEPCTFDDLCKRMNKPEWGYWTLIKSAIDQGLIYKKGDVLHCKKSTVKMLNQTGDYELPIPRHSKPVESQLVKFLRKEGLI